MADRFKLKVYREELTLSERVIFTLIIRGSLTNKEETFYHKLLENREGMFPR